MSFEILSMRIPAAGLSGTSIQSLSDVIKFGDNDEDGSEFVKIRYLKESLLIPWSS